jgi:hypothetical protein
MNAFKRKSLYTAVVAGLGALGAVQAGAVNINPDNTGEVLIYPYFTVRNNFVTSFTVVNTSTTHTTVAKVRFLEGKNSAEVLDFNLYLSPRDVWSGTITDNGTGGTLSTTDRSCTAPQVFGSYAGIPATPFVNYFYTGQVGGVAADSGGITLDRTREGYIEIIEMGVLADGALTGGLGSATDPAANPSTPKGIAVAAAVKHGSSGSPPVSTGPAGTFICGLVQDNTVGFLSNGSDILEPVDGLTGNGIIINSSNGTEFAYEPVALANFFNSPIVPNALYFPPQQDAPTLNNAFPFRSDVFVSIAGTPTVLTVSDWSAAPAGGTGIDAVSAVLMRSAILNEYDVSPNFKTDWVITEPTKRGYVFPQTPLATGPFANIFTGTSPNAVSCDPVLVTAYDREEAPYVQQQGILFSPQPQGSVAGFGNICYETTVITVAPFGVNAPAVNVASTAGIFGSVNTGFISLPANGTGTPVAPNYNAGWIGLYPTSSVLAPGNGANSGQFVTGGGTFGVVATPINIGGLRNALQVHSDGVGRRYRGLPVIGFQATQALLGGQGYGGIFDHKFNRTINAP